MVSIARSVCLFGIDGHIVEVEVDISNGIPAFEIIGLPDSTVRESRERIRFALRNIGVEVPPKKIIINLAPANIRKEGTHLDFAIAIGILASYGIINKQFLDEYVFLGELSLSGELKRVGGILPMAICAFQEGVKKIMVPFDSAPEAGVVGKLKVYGALNLKSAIEHINSIKTIEETTVDFKSLFLNNTGRTFFDFNDVKGQESSKRAIEVAVSGGHNCLMIGPPGSGKTMLAERILSILPMPSFKEILETTKIHSIAQTMPQNLPLVLERPFRSPHHSTSPTSLTGGGKIPRPGEISLAHNGVLFLDELPEFRKDALETLRQPLESNEITISRVSGTCTYPCNVMLVASMNPCPCGYYGDINRSCSCAPERITRYLNKISGPLLDRIDLHIEVFSVNYDELESNNLSETSSLVRQRVENVRNIQRERFIKDEIYTNSQMSPSLVSKYCILDENESKLLRAAFERLGLSARAHNRILKVARTLADMDKSENIKTEHLAEAIQYRSLDKKFWT